MNPLRRSMTVALVLVAPCAVAHPDAGCPAPEALLDHVMLQFELYGPRSTDREFFGFIYRHDGVIGSAVIRGRRCPDPGNCMIDITPAKKRIPRGAKVLGEWHTHVRDGSRFLSSLDVKGAYANRNIRCYVAFYSQPDGVVRSWNPNASSVPIAMNSALQVGSFDSARPRELFASDSSATRRAATRRSSPRR